MDGHDLHRRGVWLCDGLRTLPSEFTNLDHATVDCSCVVTGFITDGLYNGQPGLGELTLCIIGMSDKKI